MDLNNDGILDILSGSYSRQTPDMAGIFQVLYGIGDGTFRKAAELKGTDGQPLIIPATQEQMIEKICTRPTAADLDGDGHLDIVSGNFGGTFYLFRGTTDGGFEPTCTKLMVGDEALSVPMHSDPFLVDWDGDGDLDLFSGSARGGVFYAANTGSATEPRFAKFTEVVKPVGHGDMSESVRLRDDFLTGPQSATRVWVDDINADGKLDLLVGDTIDLYYPPAGMSDDDARAAYGTWLERQGKLFEEYPRDPEAEAEAAAWQERYAALMKDRDAAMRVENTGFVWAYYQK